MSRWITPRRDGCPTDRHAPVSPPAHREAPTMVRQWLRQQPLAELDAIARQLGETGSD